MNPQHPLLLHLFLDCASSGTGPDSYYLPWHSPTWTTSHHATSTFVVHVQRLTQSVSRNTSKSSQAAVLDNQTNRPTPFPTILYFCIFSPLLHYKPTCPSEHLSSALFDPHPMLWFPHWPVPTATYQTAPHTTMIYCRLPLTCALSSPITAAPPFQRGCEQKIFWYVPPLCLKMKLTILLCIEVCYFFKLNFPDVCKLAISTQK